LAVVTFMLADRALRFVTSEGASLGGAPIGSATVEQRPRNRRRLNPSSTYRLGRAITRCIRWCTIRVKISGEEHADLSGGGIIASTHFSHVDPMLVGAFVKRPVDWMTRIEFFKLRWLKWLLLRLDAFAVNRQGVAASAIRTAIDRVKRGRVVGICPEGGVARGQHSVCRGRAIKRGVCLVAERTGVPIVPCVLVGTHTLSSVGPWLPFRRAQIWVAFGEPLYPPSGGTSNRTSRAALAAELERRFVELYRRVLREHALDDKSIP
jgi:1-acyl-sn-glycerol-3-phosphate acyltransferase